MGLGDFHIHTTPISFCAREDSTLKNYIDACAKEGVTALGISNHFWDENVYPRHNGQWYFGNGCDNLFKIYNEIPKDTKGVKIYVGCETDFDVNNNIGISKDTAKKLDYVLIPHTHFHSRGDEEGGNSGAFDKNLDINNVDIMHGISKERFLIACNSNLPVHTCIAHPFLPHGVNNIEEQLKAFSDNDYYECFKEAKKNNIAIELHIGFLGKNTTLNAHGFSNEYVRMITISNECGCTFQIGSDAHYMGMFNDFHKKIIAFAKECNIDIDKILNTIPKR